MIDAIYLQSRDPAAQLAFYCEVLGMQRLAANAVGYGGPGQARLVISQCGGDYIPLPTDLYWKITLSVPDIELACQQLTDVGVAHDGARQFRNIGYLAQFVDPLGFKVELIQHTFKGDEPPIAPDPKLLGGGPALNLLTLRAWDMAPIEALCAAKGMTRLCVQPVEPYKFTLYFYAICDERPPNADVYAVENRPWVYQRPYTVLEIQHLHEVEWIGALTSSEAGFGGFYLASGFETSPVHNRMQDNDRLIGLVPRPE